MQNMKKILPALMSIGILLCACGKEVPKSGFRTDTDNNETETSATETGTSESAEPVTITSEEITTEVITTEAVTEEPEPESTEVELMLESLTLEEKVCQMFIVTPEQLTGYGCVTYADETLRQSLRELPVGGIILFAQNLESTDQTINLLAQSQEYAKESCGIGLFTAVDEEGGTVARAAYKLGTTSFYNMEYYGSSNDSAAAYNIGSTIGTDIGGLGFNVDFAPVADVNINPANELGSRIFSSDPYVVSNMVSNVVMGLQDSGVSATLKHFPGLGAEGGNTHYDSTVVLYRTVDDLKNAEFIPFSGGIEAGADFVMVGHQIVTGFEDNMPSDLSYVAVTEMLRGELGFDGIAVTDAQQMNTIAGVYGSGDAAVLSVKAGIDIILMPQNLRTAVSAVCNAVESGEISEERIDESVLRILECKQRHGLWSLEEE